MNHGGRGFRFGKTSCRSCELRIQVHDDFGCTIVRIQPNSDARTSLDQALSAVDQLLHRRLDARALGAVEHWRGGSGQTARADWAQDAHRLRSKLARPVVAVERARRQARQGQAGIEPRLKMPVDAVVGLQRDEVVDTELDRLARRLAIERQLGCDHGSAALVYAALGQAQQSAHTALDAIDSDRLLTYCHALSRARLFPRCHAIGAVPRSRRCHLGTSQIPLDKEVHLHQAGPVACLDVMRDAHRLEAQVQPDMDRHQSSGNAKPTGHRGDALEFEVDLGCRVLDEQAQRQVQVKPVRPEICRQRAVAAPLSIDATYAFLGRAAVVHRKGAHVRRQPAIQNDTIVSALAAQQRLDHCRFDVEQLASVCIHAPAQRRTRRQQLNCQRLLGKRMAAEILEGIEVAPGHADLNGLQRVEPAKRRLHGPQILNDQGQAGHQRTVVGELLDGRLSRGTDQGWR